MRSRCLLFVALLVLGAVIVGGCGGDSDGNGVLDGAPGGELNPEQVVQQFVADIHALDMEEAKSHVSSDYMEEFEYEFDELAEALEGDDPEAEFTRELFGAMMKNFEVSVTGHTIDGDEALVTTLNTHPDPEQFADELMGRMFEMMFSEEVDFENLTEEEEIELFMGIILEVIGEVEKVTSEGEVPMLKEDGQWKINGTVINEYMEDLDY